MSDLNVTVNPMPPLEITKDGMTAPSKDTQKSVEPARQTKFEQKLDKLNHPAQATLTDLNYSIDRVDNALHLKIKNTDGEVVREMVFDRINPSLLDAKKLKGVFIDDNS